MIPQKPRNVKRHSVLYIYMRSEIDCFTGVSGSFTVCSRMLFPFAARAVPALRPAAAVAAPRFPVSCFGKITQKSHRGLVLSKLFYLLFTQYLLNFLPDFRFCLSYDRLLRFSQAGRYVILHKLRPCFSTSSQFAQIFGTTISTGFFRLFYSDLTPRSCKPERFVVYCGQNVKDVPDAPGR